MARINLPSAAPDTNPQNLHTYQSYTSYPPYQPSRHFQDPQVHHPSSINNAFLERRHEFDSRREAILQQHLQQQQQLEVLRAESKQRDEENKIRHEALQRSLLKLVESWPSSNATPSHTASPLELVNSQSPSSDTPFHAHNTAMAITTSMPSKVHTISSPYPAYTTLNPDLTKANLSSSNLHIPQTNMTSNLQLSCAQPYQPYQNPYNNQNLQHNPHQSQQGYYYPNQLNQESSIEENFSCRGVNPENQYCAYESCKGTTPEVATSENPVHGGGYQLGNQFHGVLPQRSQAVPEQSSPKPLEKSTFQADWASASTEAFQESAIQITPQQQRTYSLGFNSESSHGGFPTLSLNSTANMPAKPTLKSLPSFTHSSISPTVNRYSTYVKPTLSIDNIPTLEATRDDARGVTTQQAVIVGQTIPLLPIHSPHLETKSKVEEIPVNGDLYNTLTPVQNLKEENFKGQQDMFAVHDSGIFGSFSVVMDTLRDSKSRLKALMVVKIQKKIEKARKLRKNHKEKYKEQLSGSIEQDWFKECVLVASPVQKNGRNSNSQKKEGKSSRVDIGTFAIKGIQQLYFDQEEVAIPETATVAHTTAEVSTNFAAPTTTFQQSLTRVTAPIAEDFCDCIPDLFQPTSITQWLIAWTSNSPVSLTKDSSLPELTKSVSLFVYCRSHIPCG